MLVSEKAMIQNNINKRHLYSLYQRIKNSRNEKGKSLCCTSWKNNPQNFFKWYEKQTHEQKGNCIYCNLPGDTQEYYRKHFRKGHRGFNLEVDRKDSKRIYSPANCVLACYPCNNAKSDVFTYQEFKRIGSSVRQVKNPNRPSKHIDNKEFKRQLGELSKIISEGIAFFTVWKKLMVEDKETAAALNRYRAFFLPVRGALHQMFLMQFAKVFDRDTRTISLRTLLILAINNPDVVPYTEKNELSELEEKIDASEELLERLKCYRDQRLAHHDSITTGNWHLQFGETTKLIDQVKAMFNILTQCHERNHFEFDFFISTAEQHTLQIIDMVIKDLIQSKQKIKELEDAGYLNVNSN